MIDKFVRFLKSIDNPEEWAYWWWFPAMAFAVGAVMFSVFGFFEPAGYSLGAAITCAAAYFFNRLFVKMLQKTNNT